MQKEIIIVGLGLIIGYFLFRFIKKQEKPTEAFSDILTSEKYKVKGQWDK